jgi:putative ABC transport system permease protein
MIIRLAIRELKYAGWKLLTVLLILAVGFVGPLFASSLGTSVSRYLEDRSRQMLAADLVVSATRAFRAEETERIRSALNPVRETGEIEFVTMARGRDVATLVEVRGTAPDFPVFGSFQLKGEAAPRPASELSLEKVAWVFPEVLAQLGLRIGDSIQLGEASFQLKGELEQAPGQGRAVGFAPRVYIGRAFVTETGLTQFGSQVFHRLYLELPRGLAPEIAAARVKAAIADQEIFLRTPDDAIQGFERFFRFFGLYLGSITMIVFVLSWVSAFYILQIYLQDRLRNAAILMINGASRLRTGAVYVVQVFVLILAAFLTASAVVFGLVALTPVLLGSLLPEGFVFRVWAIDWFSMLGVALGSALAFTSPFLVRLHSVRIQVLLGETALGLGRLQPMAVIASYLPMLAVFFGLSVWLMNSWIEALRLAGGMTLAAVLGLLTGRALFRLFFRVLKNTPGLARLVATSLSRSRFGVNLCFLALVLVALSLNLVPHLLTSVVSEVRPLKGKELPAYFLFNIPEGQVQELQEFVSDRSAELRFLSPMILGRVMLVNGKPPASEQLQRFPVRLSYREQRIPSETLIRGRDLPKSFDAQSGELPEISVEMRYAARMGFEMGDVIEFDIQGVPIEAKITSLRKVRWTDFNPNFFMVFQSGVLEDAPKTWLANLNMGGGEEEKTRIQYELVRAFPDLSVIDIGRTITRVLEVANSVIGPVTAAAWIAVAMSFLILIGIITHNLRLRHAEVDIQKILGADAPLIRRLIVGEYLATAAFAWFIGSGAALVIAWAVMTQVFEISFEISRLALAASAFVTVSVTVLIAWVSCTRVLNLRGASRKL